MTDFDPSLLPPRPSFLTDEMREAAQAKGAGTRLLASVGIVTLLLQKLEREFTLQGVPATLTTEGRRWTLTVELPEPQALAQDDVEVHGT